MFFAVFENENNSTILPVIISVTAKLKIRILYVFVSISRLLNITIHSRALENNDRPATVPNKARIAGLLSRGSSIRLPEIFVDVELFVWLAILVMFSI